MVVTKSNINYEAKRLYFHLDNLFNGNKLLGMYKYLKKFFPQHKTNLLHLKHLLCVKKNLEEISQFICVWSIFG